MDSLIKDIGKISSKQVYGLWRNLSVCFLAVTGTVWISKILPYYLSPVVALITASLLYVYIYNAKFSSYKTCIVPTVSILYSIVIYAFLTIILNLMHVWGLFEMPHEFIFFTDPFIPTLIFNPVSFIVITILYLEKYKLGPCKACRSTKKFWAKRGAAGVLLNEAHLQIKNFILLSLVLSLIVWAYYQFAFIRVNINGRDDYIFTWLTIIVVFLNWGYFSWRYYNLYLDLQENDELLTAEQIQNLSGKTYLRFYVICGNNLYLSQHTIDSYMENTEVLDTPFFTAHSLKDINGFDPKKIVQEMTGVKNGELKFFYGRKNPDAPTQSLLRYFYFLDEEKGECPILSKEGEWVSFDKVKYIYSNYPGRMSDLAVYDITRLATIILTEKIFDENGNRKSGIKSYNPTFNLIEVRKSKIDFQDDKWIEVSLFNSDTSFFKLKKWWRNKTQKAPRRIG